MGSLHNLNKLNRKKKMMRRHKTFLLDTVLIGRPHGVELFEKDQKSRRGQVNCKQVGLAYGGIPDSRPCYALC